jgi:peroxiredoxin Q/BCP
MSKAGIFVTAIIVAVVGIAAFAVHGYAADGDMPQVGQQAPGFTLPSQDLTPISLDSFKGKWVVLYFYPKDMTSGCTREAHEFQKDQDKYTKENAVILGVSVDSVDSHKQFCTKENLTFRLLADPDKKVVKAIPPSTAKRCSPNWRPSNRRECSSGRGINSRTPVRCPRAARRSRSPFPFP